MTKPTFGFLRSGYKTSTQRRVILDEEGKRVEAVNVDHWSGRMDLELRPEAVKAKLWVPGRVVDKRDMSIRPAPAQGSGTMPHPYDVPKRTQMIEIGIDQAEDLLHRIKNGDR